MNLIRKIVAMELMLLLPFGLSAQSSVAEQELSVAERNALQGFNDTIDRTAEDFVTVSLVVCDPGDVLYASFGHAMLHMQCPTFGLDYVYTYESESIRDNWGRFLKGGLKMGMFRAEADTILNYYKSVGRGVQEYRINLSPAQKQNVWRLMDELVAKGANRPYDYYHHGCALSIVQVVKRALNEERIEYGEWSDKYKGSLRELGYECVTNANRPWNRFALMTLAGSDIDDRNIAKERKLIVPADLAEVWQQATIDGRSLLDKEPHVLVPAAGEEKKAGCTPLLVSIIVLLLALFSLATLWMPTKGCRIAGDVIDYSVLVIVTLMGAVITFTVFCSSLPCTRWNWLIIPFNILPAVAWHWRKYWALPWTIVLTIWGLVMVGAWLCGHILVEWVHIILVLSFGIILLKQKYINNLKIQKR